MVDLKPLWNLNNALQIVYLYLADNSAPKVPELDTKERASAKYGHHPETNKFIDKYKTLDREGYFNDVEGMGNGLEEEQAKLILDSVRNGIDLLNELDDPTWEKREATYATKFEPEKALRDAKAMSDKLTKLYEDKGYFQQFGATTLSEFFTKNMEEAEKLEKVTAKDVMNQRKETNDYFSGFLQSIFPNAVGLYKDALTSPKRATFEYEKNKIFACDTPQYPMKDVLEGKWEFTRIFKMDPEVSLHVPLVNYAVTHEKVHYAQALLDHFHFNLPIIFRQPIDGYASTNLSLAEALGDMIPNHGPIASGKFKMYIEVFNDFMLFHRACIAYMDYMHFNQKVPYKDIWAKMKELGMPDAWIMKRMAMIMLLPQGYIPCYYEGIRKGYKKCGINNIADVVGEFKPFDVKGDAHSTIRLLFASGGANMDHVLSNWKEWVKYIKDNNPGKI